MTTNGAQRTVDSFLDGKSAYTRDLFDHFIRAFREVGPIDLHAAKTMIGISNGQRRIAWITQLGKQFIHVVFPFPSPYPDNLCFTKIAQVPGDDRQFNHHFRMVHRDDVNEEVTRFMAMAYRGV